MFHPEFARAARAAQRAFRAALLVLTAAAAFSVAACVDPPTEHRLRANAFLRGGDAASAVKECDLGLEKKKDDIPLLILRGKALFELDKLDESRGAYAQAVTAGKDL